MASVLRIRPVDIDDGLARGGTTKEDGAGSGIASVRRVAGDRVLLLFLACAFLFHFANAAMLPELGEMLSRGAVRTAAPFMSACILVTQGVIMCSAGWIGKLANDYGRKLLLLVGFGVLPVRAVLYTVTHATGALIAIQLLDGVANAIFSVVAVLVVADRTRGTGAVQPATGSAGNCYRHGGGAQHFIRWRHCAACRVRALVSFTGGRRVARISAAADAHAGDPR